MPLREALTLCFRCVDISQCDSARVVSVLYHVRKLCPRRGFGQSPLRENKTAVLCVVIYDRTCLEHLTPPVMVCLVVTNRGYKIRNVLKCLWMTALYL